MDINMVRLPKKLTPKEHKYCAKKEFCFCCHKSGHMVSICSTFSDLLKKPHIQHAQKEEKLPKLKEIEDDNKEDEVAWVSFRLDKDF